MKKDVAISTHSCWAMECRLTEEGFCPRGKFLGRLSLFEDYFTCGSIVVRYDRITKAHVIENHVSVIMTQVLMVEVGTTVYRFTELGRDFKASTLPFPCSRTWVDPAETRSKQLRTIYLAALLALVGLAVALGIRSLLR